MGAQSFVCEARGKSMGEAFMSAVDEALHWNGHGGYTGTIAEKPGATLFDVPLSELPERYQDVEMWDSDAKSMVVKPRLIPTIDRLENAIYWYANACWEWDENRRDMVKIDPFSASLAPSTPHWLKDKPEELAKYQAEELARMEAWKADAEFFAKKMGLAKWDKLVETYNQKWDECVAIKTGEDWWTFMGLASC